LKRNPDLVAGNGKKKGITPKGESKQEGQAARQRKKKVTKRKNGRSERRKKKSRRRQSV